MLLAFYKPDEEIGSLSPRLLKHVPSSSECHTQLLSYGKNGPVYLQCK